MIFIRLLILCKFEEKKNIYIYMYICVYMYVCIKKYSEIEVIIE